MTLGSTHKVVHTLENRYKTNTEKTNSIIMNYVKYMRIHILTPYPWDIYIFNTIFLFIKLNILIINIINKKIKKYLLNYKLWNDFQIILNM